MACYSPVPAYRLDGRRKLSLKSSDAKSAIETLKLPCGQCVGCRLRRSSTMGMRCLHEAELQPGGMPNNSFVTLTYNDESLPYHGALCKRDFQLFMMRLRKHIYPARVRFYACGEYAPLNWRPHFHALLFGYRFPDLVFGGKGKSGHPVYNSELLSRLWGKGFANVGDVTFQSAAYVARYCMKKVNGVLEERHYSRVDAETGEIYRLPKEFALMSLKPGIGAAWFEKFHADVFPHDYCVIDGQKAPVPRYYDRLYERMQWLLMQEVREARVMKAEQHAADNTPARLAVRSEVAEARSNQFKKDRF